MDYKPMELNSPLFGLVVRNPVGQEATAVLENLTDSYGTGNFMHILDEIKRLGVRNVILDLSQFPVISGLRLLIFLDNILTKAHGFETRYIGTYNGIPLFTGSLDAAVESFNR